MKKHNWILINITVILVQLLYDGLINTGVHFILFPIMFIIMTLPYKRGTIPTMLTAFALGIFIDLMNNEIIGLNAAAATALAFCRRGLLQMIAGPFIMDNVERPDLFNLGYIKVIGYSALCSLIALSVFVFAENGGFSDIFMSLGRIGLSTVLNTFLMTVMFSVFGQRRRL